MRQGQNPLRIARAEHGYQPVVLTVVTHLPNLDGYHEKRLEVVQTCLTTMRQGAHRNHTFIVWDNGSCPSLTNWLANTFHPDMLMLSPNIGKTAARTSLIRMLSPETIVGYSDDDMYFYDNWLTPQIDLLQHFPNVACVTGYPVRTAFRWGNDNTKAWAKKHAALKESRTIPREWEDDFARSIGRDPEWHAQYSANDYDALITYKGKQAYATSHHVQFIGYQKQLVQATRYDGKAMGEEQTWDITLDTIGLRLATTDRYCRHIGNVLDEELK